MSAKPVFRVPSFKDVEANQAAKPKDTNLFKPSGVASSVLSKESSTSVVSTISSAVSFHSEKSVPNNPQNQVTSNNIQSRTAAPRSSDTPFPSATSNLPSAAKQSRTENITNRIPVSSLNRAQSFNEAFGFLRDTPEYTPPTTNSNDSSSRNISSNQSGLKSIPVVSYVPNTNSIIVNPRQRGNPIVDCIRNVAWEFGEIVPDFVVGQTSCVLFLSLRYHRLHPEYIYHRIQLLGTQYLLRVVLILVDIDDHQPTLRELHKPLIINNFTIILAWTQEEAARYIETFKVYEFKGPDVIREKAEEGYMAKLTSTLTQVKSVNKTDVLTLSSNFGSLKAIIEAPPEKLQQCPGFGEQKVRRLHEACRQPFKINKSRKKNKLKVSDGDKGKEKAT